MCIFPLVLFQNHSVSSNLLVNSTQAMSPALEQATGGGAPQPAKKPMRRSSLGHRGANKCSTVPANSGVTAELPTGGLRCSNPPPGGTGLADRMEITPGTAAVLQCEATIADLARKEDELLWKADGLTRHAQQVRLMREATETHLVDLKRAAYMSALRVAFRSGPTFSTKASADVWSAAPVRAISTGPRPPAMPPPDSLRQLGVWATPSALTATATRQASRSPSTWRSAVSNWRSQAAKRRRLATMAEYGRLNPC